MSLSNQISEHLEYIEFVDKLIAKYGGIPKRYISGIDPYDKNDTVSKGSLSN